MHSFIWVVSVIDFSHHAFGNPLSEEFSNSDLLSDNALIFNDIETPNSPSVDLAPQDPSFSDPTSIQSPDISSLTDSSTPPFDTTELSVDFSNALLENSPSSDFSDVFLESSCGETDDGDFQSVFKRDDSGVCSASKAEADPLHLNLPDLLNDFKKPVESGLQELPRLETFPIPPTPGYTIEDDKNCRAPRRRLCCQGPLGWGDTAGYVGHCRGMEDGFFFLFFFLVGCFGPFSSVLGFPIFIKKRGRFLEDY